jgi:hypothetical protein
MNDDYLWDRSGEPDPEVARLEHLLEPLRHRPGTLDFSRRFEQPVTARAPAWSGPWLAIAAGLFLAVVTGIWHTWPRLASDTPGGPWVASPVHGSPTLGSGRRLADAAVVPDEWIETDRSSSVRLVADEVGTVDLRPGSRLRIVRTRPGEYRMALAKGSLQARIWARPGRFAVETPSAVALDLGCSYTLEVDGQGAGRLSVVSGWVGLDSRGMESLVPQGASCLLTESGPGTPHFDDAPTAFVDAVSRIDARGDAALLEDVRAAVKSARARDAFTLWHLLQRLSPAGAAVVCDRLVVLAPPPPGVTRERVLARDGASLEAWWDSLGLGSSSLFRTWRARSYQ